MHDVEYEYKLLKRFVENLIETQRYDSWGYCFHWWRLFYYLNRNLDEVKKVEEKVAIIERFIAFFKEMDPIQKTFNEIYHVNDKLLERVQNEDVPISSEMKEITRLLKDERQRFTKNMREVKRASKGGKKKASIRPKKRFQA